MVRFNYEYKKHYENEDYSDNIRNNFNRVNRWGFDREFESYDVEVYMEHQLKAVKEYFVQRGANGNGIHLADKHGNNWVFGKETYGTLLMEVEKRLLRMWYSWVIERKVEDFLLAKGWETFTSTNMDYVMGVDIVARNKEGKIFLIHVQSNGGRNWSHKKKAKARFQNGITYERNWNRGSHVEFNYTHFNNPLDFGQIENWEQTKEETIITQQELDYFTYLENYQVGSSMFYPTTRKEFIEWFY